MPEPHSTSVAPHVGNASAVGLRFDLTLGEVRATVVSARQDARGTAPSISHGVLAPLSRDLLRQIRRVELDQTSLSEREQLVAHVTEIACDLVQRLLGEVSDEISDVLAIGVHGGQVWDLHEPTLRCCRGLCNPAALAEATGKTIVDDFPARDLVQGGLGGPVEAHGLWLLLADRLPVPGQRWRAAAQLSDTFHITVLPPLDELSRRRQMVSCDIGPGLSLFKELLDRSPTAGANLADRGHLAAQGRVIPDLVDRWTREISDDYTWRPHGISVLPLLYALESVEKSSETAELPDLLATAAHFLAKRVEVFVNHGVPIECPIGELVLMGEGRHNGLLLNQLNRWLPAVQIRDIEDLGFDDYILAAAIGALALLHLWQVPLAPSPGAATPRVLGRLTPGSPSNWQRVLRLMNSQSPWMLPLRDAI